MRRVQTAALGWRCPSSRTAAAGSAPAKRRLSVRASRGRWDSTATGAEHDPQPAVHRPRTTTLGAVEDYTSKYKGEQVEVALFGGEYQEGVLTAYCYVDEVAHIELNGHILVPLQNIASLHCSSRCDAPQNEDWPPRGLLETTGRTTAATTAEDAVGVLVALRNIVKAWLLVAGARRRVRRSSAGCSAACALLSIFVFCALLLARRRVLDVRPRRARDDRRARASARRGAAPPLHRRASRGARRDREAAPLSDPGRPADRGGDRARHRAARRSP